MIKKCLKGLCILWLILLPISFTSGWSVPWIWLYWNSTIVVSDNLDFTTTWQWSTTFNWFYAEYHWYSNPANFDAYWLGWKDWKLYIVSRWKNGQMNYQNQWFLDSVCNTTLTWSCSNYNTDVSEFYNALKKWFTEMSVSRTNWFYYALNVCFNNSTTKYCLWLSPRTKSSSYPATSSLSWSLGLTISSLSSTVFQDLSWWNSPYEVWIAEVPDYTRGSNTFTNQDIIDWYNAMWLTDWFCYWWFPISNIFENWQVPQEFTWYIWWSWANILDIWDQYKTAFNNDHIAFLRSFYVAFENDNYSSFYGYPKALYWFFNQYFAVNLNGRGFWAYNSDFTITNIWEYCNLKNADPSAVYTWDTRKAKFSYRNKDVLNNEWRFNFSWNNSLFSWSLSWFNDPSDFFASLNAVFQWWLRDLWTTRQPLLPSYIIIFMFAIILIRIISH